ncbi:MAG: carboxypeptidase regulatory-like domain-containing protein [Planctomycetia bacterium]|nr:carboxypeptidase regulatory-like domain-containing protein [Planctomycetia bacterium]
MIRRVFTLGVVAGLGLAVGCGKAADTRPKRVPFSGKVTLDGTPIEGATVVLAPESGSGAAASGMTNAEGVCAFTTYESRDGAVPGRYLVTVAKTEFPEGRALTADDPSYDPSTAVAAVVKGSKELLPAKYKTAKTSGLTVEVKDGENPVAAFDLKK